MSTVRRACCRRMSTIASNDCIVLLAEMQSAFLFVRGENQRVAPLFIDMGENGAAGVRAVDDQR